MSFNYSLNNLRTNALTYSLNNLNTMLGIDQIATNPPILNSTTGSSTTIYLAETANIVRFDTYTKGIHATTGIFDNIQTSNFSATGVLNATEINAQSGTFKDILTTTLTATGTIYGNAAANFPNADVSVYGITANLNGIKSLGALTGPSVFANSGTFNKLDVNVANIHQLNLTGTYIHNLQWNVATGATSYLGKVNTTIADRCKFDTFQADSSIFTPQMQLDNTSIRVDALNDLELVANSPGRIFFRRGQSDVGNQITMEPEYGSFYCPTGYFTGLVAGDCEFSNAKILLSITGPLANFNNAYFDNLYVKNFLGSGTFQGLIRVQNNNYIQFLASDGSEIAKLTPSATTSPPSLSYSTTALVGAQLQQTFTTSGTTLSQINDISSQTSQVLSRADIKQLSVNYVGSVTNDLTVSGKASIGYLVASPSNGLLVQGNTSIGTSSNVNKLDVSGGVAVGSYAGVNSVPTNGLLVSGNVGIGTTTVGQQLTVASDASVSNGLWSNRINIGGTLSTANKGFELDCKGYQHFYTHTNSNGFQLDIGSSGPYSNFRSGYFYKPDASFSSDKTLYINNQDGADASNTYRGAISLLPNNGSLGSLTCYGNGQSYAVGNLSGDYVLRSTQNNAGGYGFRHDSYYGGGYLLQLNGLSPISVFDTAFTVHSNGNGVVVGSAGVGINSNYPFNITPMASNRYWSTFMAISNHSSRSQGTMFIGMLTGSNCEIGTTTSANNLDIVPNGSQRCRFSQNGEIFFNGQSTTTASVTNSTMTITSTSYFGGGGTAYSPTLGLGAFVCLVNIYHNAGFAIAAGGPFVIASTEYYRTNHSAWVVAGGVNQLNCDFTGKYCIEANITLQMDTQYAYATYYLFINGGAYTLKTCTNCLANGYISMTICQTIQLSVGDTIAFWLYISGGNGYILGGSNVSMRYVF